MPRSCVAPGCSEGYGSSKSKLSFFSAPKDPVKRSKWQRAISRSNFELKHGQVLCEKHFLPHDIIRKKFFKDAHGNVIAEANLGNPKLADDAIPTLFPGYLTYINKMKSKLREPIIRSDAIKAKQPKIACREKEILESEPEQILLTAFGSSVPSKHFGEDQWEVTRVDGKKKLKANAVPTIFETSKTKQSNSRKIEQKKGKSVKQIDVSKTCDISMKTKNWVKPAECFVCCCLIASKNAITVSSLTTTSGVTMKQRLIGISNISVSKLESSLKNGTNWLCNRCARLINYVDRMEAEMALLKGAISGCLHDKISDEDSDTLMANMASHSLILDQFDIKLKDSFDDDSVSNDNAEKDPLCSDVEENISEDKNDAADIGTSCKGDSAVLLKESLSKENSDVVLQKSLQKENNAVLLKESLQKDDDVVLLNESLPKQGNAAILKDSLNKDDEVIFLNENLPKEDDILLLKESQCKKKDKVVLLKSSENCDSEVVPGREKTTEEECNYQCKICLIRTTSRSVLIFHLRKHMANYQWCDFCSVPLKSDEENSSDEVQA